jgi:hypothetical protein
MKHGIIISVMIIMALGLAGLDRSTWAAGSEAEDSKEKVTVIGEVIDPVCYIRHDSRGVDHKKCAEYCAGLGITLAILNEANDEVLLAFPVGHTDPNEKVRDFISQRVKPTGVIHERGGLKGIEVVTIEPVKKN